jgi:hypothetical protein
MTTIRALSDSTFQKQLAFGQIAETVISRWLMSRGLIVLPIYDIEYHTGKGPRLFSADGSMIAPDILVIGKNRQAIWIEAKHKTVFSWYRIGKRWVTGIDLYHYRQYLEVEKRIQWPIWILFYHESGTPNHIDLVHGCPSSCPVGLFGAPLCDLAKKENQSHASNRHGKSGMIYWGEGNLRLLATKEQIA